MSDTIYLYLKTHNKTGLKYLGITKQDPYKYMGSGLYWTSHLEAHGPEHSTEVLHECTEEDVEKWGRYYSEKYNVVESKEFANLKPETGYGGTGMTGKTQSEETRQKIRDSLTGVKHTEERRRKNSEAHNGQVPWNKGLTNATSHTEEHKQYMSNLMTGEGNHFYGKSHTKETRSKMSEAALKRRKITCPHCGKETPPGLHKRWHGDNCRKKKNES